MARRDRKDRIFRPWKKTKLLRKHLSREEVATGVGLLVILLVAGVWVVLQRDNFDPGERDIDIAVLRDQSVADELYRTPFKEWRDPAQAGAAGQAAPAVDLGPLLPASVLSGGWQRGGRPQVFGDDTLYEKINGQAEQYRKFGFKELHFVTIKDGSGQLTIDIYIYDQGGFVNCLGLYAEQRAKKPVVDLEGVLHTPHGLGAIGMAGRHFFHITGNKRDPAIVSKAREIVQALSKLASGGGAVPLPYRILRAANIPFAQIEYQPDNVFQYDFAKRFWFGRTSPRGDTKVFVHVAASDAAAKKVFDAMHTEQQENDYQVLESDASHALYKHAFLNHFALYRKGQLLYGLENLPNKAEVLDLIGRLGKAIEAAQGGSK